MACFSIRRAAARARDPAVVLCVVLCLFLPRPGRAHPAIETRIELLNRRIAAEPDNAGLFLQRGELHREHHSWAEAEADYAESRRLDPDLAAVDFSLAKLRYETGRDRDAIALLDRYLVKVPDDGAALALRAEVRRGLRENLEAAADYDRAITAMRAAGQQPAPHLYLGRSDALVAAGEQFIAAALQGLEDGLDRLGRPITLELEALDLELRLGRFDQALARVDGRLAEARRPGPWLIRRGEVLESAGRYEEARAAYEGARADFETRAAGRRDAPAVARQVELIRDALARVEARLDAEVDRRKGDGR